LLVPTKENQRFFVKIKKATAIYKTMNDFGKVHFGVDKKYQELTVSQFYHCKRE